MGPASLIVAVAVEDLDVVLLIVTGTETVSFGLRNRGKAELNTIGSATVIVDSAFPE